MPEALSSLSRKTWTAVFSNTIRGVAGQVDLKQRLAQHGLKMPPSGPQISSTVPFGRLLTAHNGWGQLKKELT